MRVLSALLLSGIRPRWVARLCRDTSLPMAYLVHWLGLVLFVALHLWIYSHYPYADNKIAGILRAEVILSPAGALVCAITVLATEALFLLLALMLVPWNECSARPSLIWRQALRTAWVHTGHLGLAALFFSGVMTLVEVAKSEWGYFDVPEPFFSVLRWAVRSEEHVYATAFACAAGWYAWALLRAMTTRLLPDEGPSPPLCEACGYNLSHHEMSARCPECGRAVALSLGGEVRSPVGWGPFGKRYRPTLFWRATVQAWSKPAEFFMGVSASRGLDSAGRFLLNHLLLSWVGAVTGFVSTFSVLMHSEFVRQPGELTFYMTCFGAFLATCFAALASLTAAIAGLVVSRQDRRNRIGACRQVACFCAGLFPVWAFTFTASFVVLMVIVDSLRGGGPWGGVLTMLAVFGSHVLFLALYLSGVLRRIRYVRYANT